MIPLVDGQGPCTVLPKLFDLGHNFTDPFRQLLQMVKDDDTHVTFGPLGQKLILLKSFLHNLSFCLVWYGVVCYVRGWYGIAYHGMVQ